MPDTGNKLCESDNSELFWGSLASCPSKSGEWFLLFRYQSTLMTSAQKKTSHNVHKTQTKGSSPALEKLKPCSPVVETLATLAGSADNLQMHIPINCYLREKWLLWGERFGGDFAVLVREGEEDPRSPCPLALDWSAGGLSGRLFVLGDCDWWLSPPFPADRLFVSTTFGSPPWSRPVLDPTSIASRLWLNSLRSPAGIMEGDCLPEGDCWLGDGGREQLLWQPSPVVRLLPGLPIVMELLVRLAYPDLFTVALEQ